MARPMHVAARMTKEQFLRLPETPGLLLELLDGEVLTMNAPTREHQVVLLELSYELMAWRKGDEGAGQLLLGTDTDITSHPDTVFVPDFQWYAADRGLPLKSGPIWPTGDLVIEILSPSTRSHDLVTKRERYLASGARELWFVDPLRTTVLAVRPGEPDTLLGPGETLTSPLLPGFALELERLRVA